jgi:hypothetical protein
MATGKTVRRRAALLCTAAVALLGATACQPKGWPGGPIYGYDPAIDAQPGARTTVVTYGPATVPAATSAAHDDAGMLPNVVVTNVAKPCTDCYITGIQADLRYADGTPANIDTGLWLHHMVLATAGRPDPTCNGKLIGRLGERFFASGNERTRLLSPKGYGYLVDGHPWNLVYDLMNQTQVPKDVRIEVTFNWVPASTPGITALKPVWLDVDQCGLSEVPAKTGKYQYDYTWSVNVPGRIIGVGAHVHDSGIDLQVVDDDTKTLICDSVARYGGPGFEEPADPMGGMEHGHGAASPPSTDGHGHTDDDHARLHISGMTQCLADATTPVYTLTSGKKVSIHARYDTIKRPTHGTHPVMGIALLYIAP